MRKNTPRRKINRSTSVSKPAALLRLPPSARRFWRPFACSRLALRRWLLKALLERCENIDDFPGSAASRFRNVLLPKSRKLESKNPGNLQSKALGDVLIVTVHRKLKPHGTIEESGFHSPTFLSLKYQSLQSLQRRRHFSAIPVRFLSRAPRLSEYATRNAPIVP